MGSQRGNRLHGLDTLRGATLVSMIAYHACWDLVWIFGVNLPWYRTAGAYVWQQSICWTFILLSGYCWSLGRHRLKRGLLAFGGGALVSAVTALFLPENAVRFGVLTLLGSAGLLLIPLEPLLRRLPARAGLAGSFTLFLLLRDVNEGYLGFEGGRVLALPQAWYRNAATAYLGFPAPGFFSTDYFSLLPWLFLFLTGYFLWRLRPEDRGPGPRLPVLTALGRHSLVVYLLHQPVVYALLYALVLGTAVLLGVSLHE
ncbi:heparan-alpha-glucosaminide N-acetyltransferase domain-containing protein [uncultured Oscillibacter sp.]|uniref:heparan-alpha-glucosaminide N-acetyltransferase domain-containing protein n=1 Tax=uncultured Oscillibacter sp. TaxID=876091 RepID=UPI0025CCE499|nr:heparan-alpha-glucosaminide N-acetyltransferase domain-containing protein [uncultured Oscillibacter sp.]